MSLRQRISLAAAAFRFGGSGAMAPATLPTSYPWAGSIAGLVWLLFGSGVLRTLILPWLFPATRCPGCRRIVPLFGRWKCGDHYTDHRDRHILAFLCPHGHRLEGFNCPRCRSTILVQRGDQKFLRSGSALQLRTESQVTGHRGLLLGHDSRHREVRLPDSVLAWHVAITGGTGRGKSTLLAHLARQLAEAGYGFTLLDPGGDLAKAVLSQIPPNREEDVLYLNVADRVFPFPLNILHAASDLERSVLAEELIGVFEKLHGAAWGPMLEHQLRMALRAVMEAGGTLRDVYDLFTLPATRARVIPVLRDPALRAFWADEFPTIPAVRRSAVTNKLAPIVFHPILSKIIGAKDCAFDADEAVREYRICIVNLATGSPGDEVTTLLGTFLVQRIIAAAFRQAHLPEGARRRHVLLVDEFQRFMHRAASFDQILAEARKYKLSLIVANQYVEQLAPAVRAALFGNVGCLIAFRVGPHDARLLEPEFRGCVRDDLLELQRGQSLVRIGGDWTTIRTLPPIHVTESDPTARIIARMQDRFATVNSQEDRGQDKPQQDEDDEFVR